MRSRGAGVVGNVPFDSLSGQMEWTTCSCM
jgi:hypothetical protein